MNDVKKTKTTAEPTVEDAIKEALANPASVSVDGQSVSQHNLKDLIEVDKYLEAKKQGRSNKLGIRVSKMVRGGYND